MEDLTEIPMDGILIVPKREVRFPIKNHILNHRKCKGKILIFAKTLIVVNMSPYRKETPEKYLSSSPIVFIAACIPNNAHEITFAQYMFLKVSNNTWVQEETAKKESQNDQVILACLQLVGVTDQ